MINVGMSLVLLHVISNGETSIGWLGTSLARLEKSTSQLFAFHVLTSLQIPYSLLSILPPSWCILLLFLLLPFEILREELCRQHKTFKDWSLGLPRALQLMGQGRQNFHEKSRTLDSLE